MKCKVCIIREAKGKINNEDIKLLCNIETKEEIACCNKCKYLWNCDDIKKILNIN